MKDFNLAIPHQILPRENALTGKEPLAKMNNNHQQAY